MPTLFSKMLGCLAASRIGSAMGAVVECWPREMVEQRFGYVDDLHPYEHYNNGWVRMAGTTEDGIERQKIMIAAIERVGGRISAVDYGRAVCETVDLEHAAYMTEPNDRQVLKLIQQGVPAHSTGLLTTWSGLNSIARASHPIALINAGDPEAAARDVRDVGQVCFDACDISHDWGAIYAAGVAHACEPNASVESVIETARAFASDRIRDDLERGLGIAEKHNEYEPFRAAFYDIFSGRGGYYPFSSANEVVTKAFSLLMLTRGNVKQSILCGVNFGRDTDCLAATCGGLAGALNGHNTIPAKWIEQVDEATMANAHTSRQTTIQEDAQVLMQALRKRAGKMRRLADMIDASPAEDV